MQLARSETALARAQVRLSRTLRQDRSLDRVLQEIAAAAADIVPGTQCAGIVAIRRGHSLRSAAYSDELASWVDRAHAESEEGPCLTEGDPESVHVIEDMSFEERWPRFARKALELGVAGMVSCGLYDGPDQRYVLNVYAPRPGVFDTASAQHLAAFAAFGSLALADAVDIRTMQQELVTRQTIGEATGMLMQRHAMTSREALRTLQESAARQGVPLWAMAGLVVLGRTESGPTDRTQLSGDPL